MSGLGIFTEGVMDERARRLSARARALLRTISGWVSYLPDGTVHVTRELFPPDDDYGSELVVTMQREMIDQAPREQGGQPAASPRSEEKKQ